MKTENTITDETLQLTLKAFDVARQVHKQIEDCPVLTDVAGFEYLKLNRELRSLAMQARLRQVDALASLLDDLERTLRRRDHLTA